MEAVKGGKGRRRHEGRKSLSGDKNGALEGYIIRDCIAGDAV